MKKAALVAVLGLTLVLSVLGSKLSQALDEVAENASPTRGVAGCLYNVK